MFKIKEFKELKSSLLNSCKKRKIALEDFYRIERLISIRESNPSMIDKRILKLLQLWILRLPNVVEERKLFSLSGRVLRSTESFNKNLDHKEVCKRSSKLFDLSPDIYGKGLFAISEELNQGAELVKEFLKRHLRTFKVTFVSCPEIVTDKMLTVTGQFPKFRKEVFQISERYFLSPTGEVQLGNLRVEAPVLLATLSKCYRREKGYGKSHKGLIRNLEFEKLELFGYSDPSQSWERFFLALLIVTSAVRKMGFTYRIVELPIEEISFAAAKTLDIEVWLPVSRTWMEISSISNCLDYQSRRGQLRWKKIFPHTFNASCLPIGRTLVALSEYYQEDISGKLDINKLRNLLETNCHKREDPVL